MAWSKEHVLALLREYGKYPQLYDVRNRLYKDKFAQYEALKKVARAISYLRPGTKPAQVHKKFVSLRGTFNVAQKKSRPSTESGESDVSTPSLYYYQLMAKIVNPSDTRVAINSARMTAEKYTNVGNKTSLPVQKVNIPSPSVSSPSMPGIPCAGGIAKKRTHNLVGSIVTAPDYIAASTKSFENKLRRIQDQDILDQAIADVDLVIHNFIGIYKEKRQQQQ